MPPGSKKRKALKKKKKQEAIGNSTNNTSFNGHGNISGHDEHGSQDEIESDGNLSSPSSQGNGEFWTRDLSPSPLSGLGKVTTIEKTEDADVTNGQRTRDEDVIAVDRGTDREENGVDKPSNSFPENFAHTTRKVDDGIAPVLDSVKLVGSSTSTVLISDKNEQVESSTVSVSVKQKFDENEEKCNLKEAKEGNILGSSVETSTEIMSVNESEIPECSEEKSLVPSAPSSVRTSWLSCCGLFDVMIGSER